MIALRQPELIVMFVLLIFIVMVVYGVSFVLSEHYAGRLGFLCCWSLNWILLLLMSLFLFYNVILCHVDAYLEWLTLTIPYLLPITFGFIADELSVKMACVVLFISFCVQLFALVYMRNEVRQIHFMVILHVFTFFMLLFVFSINLLQAFVAWEGLGFVSFALINFWNAREEANKAAVKAIVFNRLADIWFILAIIISLFCFNTVDFLVLNSISCCDNNVLMFVPFFGSVRAIDFIAFSLFFAAIGKSAQLGYHVWLTAAMEGPSPVSALLHSATMVTAGVLLLLRCSDIFSNCNPTLLACIILVGLTTCFFCGWFAFIALDFKRMIAYSTCSHLGLMFGVIGFNFLEVAELHVHIHAFFKTTLFLCAGLVMALMLHLQNFRKISSFALFLPICYSLLTFSSISLLGFPATIGSMSKERFIMLAYVNADASFILKLHFIASIIALITALLYTIRLILNVAYQPGFNGERRFPFFLESESSGVWFSQFILCVGIIVLCNFFVMISIRSLIMFNPWYWINTFSVFYQIHFNSVPLLVKIFIIVLLFMFYIFFVIMLKKFQIIFYLLLLNCNAFFGTKLNLYWVKVLEITHIKIYIDTMFVFFNKFESYLATIYYTIIKFYMKCCFLLFMAWERGFIEIIGPQGIIKFLRNLKNKTVSFLQTGFITEYIYDIFMFLLLLIIFLYCLSVGISLHKLIIMFVLIIIATLCV